jgi:hypothetical protein
LAKGKFFELAGVSGRFQGFAGIAKELLVEE